MAGWKAKAERRRAERRRDPRRERTAIHWAIGSVKGVEDRGGERRSLSQRKVTSGVKEMKKVYRARYSFMLRNPGRQNEGAFLVEACNFYDALALAKDFLEKGVHAEIKQLEGLEGLGEIVAR